MTERWVEYFVREKRKYHSIMEYAVEHWSYNASLYRKIKKLIPPPARILEVGCGIGFSSIYLSECGYQVVGIDNDDKIINEAKRIGEYLKSKVKFKQGDAFDLSDYYRCFDLVFSCRA